MKRVLSSPPDTSHFRVLVVAVVLLTGCSSGATTGSATTSVAVPTVPTSDVMTTTTPSATGEVVVVDGDTGRSVRVPLGGVLVVRFSNSYWKFQPAADQAVLRLDGDRTVTPDRSGSCIPGGGCAEVSQRYRAVAPGQTTVSATRTNCGEALACPPDQTTWTITAAVG